MQQRLSSHHQASFCSSRGSIILLNVSARRKGAARRRSTAIAPRADADLSTLSTIGSQVSVEPCIAALTALGSRKPHWLFRRCADGGVIARRPQHTLDARPPTNSHAGDRRSRAARPREQPVDRSWRFGRLLPHSRHPVASGPLLSLPPGSPSSNSQPAHPHALLPHQGGIIDFYILRGADNARRKKFAADEFDSAGESLGKGNWCGALSSTHATPRRTRFPSLRLCLRWKIVRQQAL